MQLLTEGLARKRIYTGGSVRIENSVTRDNCSASLGKPRHLGCRTFTLVTEFSIRTSQPLKILIICPWSVSVSVRSQLVKSQCVSVRNQLAKIGHNSSTTRNILIKAAYTLILTRLPNAICHRSRLCRGPNSEKKWNWSYLLSCVEYFYRWFDGLMHPPPLSKISSSKTVAFISITTRR